MVVNIYVEAFPEVQMVGGDTSDLKRQRMYKVAPLDKFVEACSQEWYSYCKQFKLDGDDRPFPVYPYTVEYMQPLIDEVDGRRPEDPMEMIGKMQLKEINKHGSVLRSWSPNTEISMLPANYTLTRLASRSPERSVAVAA